jgi:hypothetical protein
VSPVITVLTTIYNGERYIAETVASIKAQTYPDWEHLIVDDASDDGRTPELLERLASTDPRIRVIRRRERGGPFAAANEGLRSATGNYVMRTDADDVSLPTRFEKQLAWLSTHPEQHAVGSYWHLFNDRGELYSDVRTVPLFPRVFKWRYFLRGGPPHSSLCIERDALTEIGGYKERPVAQDYRLLLDLSRRDWLGIVPEVLVHYRRHGSQIHATAQSLQETEAYDALADHIAQLAPGAFDAGEIAILRQAGRSPVPLRPALVLLRCWQDLWEADPALGAQERAALQTLADEVHDDLLRVNFRKTTVRDAARTLAKRVVRRMRGR